MVGRGRYGGYVRSRFLSVFPYGFHMFSIYFICFPYVFLDAHSINTLRDHSFGSFVCRLDGVMRENGYLPG